MLWTIWDSKMVLGVMATFLQDWYRLGMLGWLGAGRRKGKGARMLRRSGGILTALLTRLFLVWREN